MSNEIEVKPGQVWRYKSSSSFITLVFVYKVDDNGISCLIEFREDELSWRHYHGTTAKDLWLREHDYVCERPGYLSAAEKVVTHVEALDRMFKQVKEQHQCKSG